MHLNGKASRTIWTKSAEGDVVIIDQTRLPHKIETVTLRTEDDAAFALLCAHYGEGDETDDQSDRAVMMTSACSSARSRQKSRAEAVLLANPAALSPRCTRLDEEAKRAADAIGFSSHTGLLA